MKFRMCRNFGYSVNTIKNLRIREFYCFGYSVIPSI